MGRHKDRGSGSFKGVEADTREKRWTMSWKVGRHKDKARGREHWLDCAKEMEVCSTLLSPTMGQLRTIQQAWAVSIGTSALDLH
eukprot:1146135-Pelagomonas_calceolata.AAC.4